MVHIHHDGHVHAARFQSRLVLRSFHGFDILDAEAFAVGFQAFQHFILDIHSEYFSIRQ